MVIKSPQGEKFREFAKAHGDKTQVEMAKLWEGEMSSRTISRALKKIGFTRKKRPTAFQEPDEAKPQAFFAELSTLSPSLIVYLDESGMDNRDQYDYAWNQRGQRFHALKSFSARRSGEHDCSALQPKHHCPFYRRWRV
jgi:DNA-binding GntR family transcriptional regulator